MAPNDRVVAERIDDWRRRLIDLSFRNRLIRYRPTRARTIEIEAPTLDALLEDPSRTAPWRFYFPPELCEDDEVVASDDASFIDEIVVRSAQHRGRPPAGDEIVARGEANPKRINRLLENLARKSNAEFQDEALRIPYIAAGFLDWTDSAREEQVSSPLILVPVELRRVAASQPYELYFVGEEITINPSVTEKLSPRPRAGHPEDWVWEDKPVGTELDEIEQAIADTGWTTAADRQLEREANVFAAELLLPEDPVRKAEGENRFGVSDEPLGWRLHQSSAYGAAARQRQITSNGRLGREDARP